MVEFAAEQAEVDQACAPAYLARPKTAYEHAWEIRDLLGLPECADREQEQDVQAFIAGRVWASADARRPTRAVVYVPEAGILLPAVITTLTRLVSEVRRAENFRLRVLLAERTPVEMAVALRCLLQVPEDRRVSVRELEVRRQTAMLPATVRHLGAASIDDSLDVLGLGTSVQPLAPGTIMVVRPSAREAAMRPK
ncbi:DUF4158 domain-containing protein [Spirillospora sp. CA-142024]|uniref:DUF4158 domain-containing protein n=1 Tax=Spirillospora sp. CA-142024 TaxID=3240036 RepID=UPI003D8BE569